MLDVKASYRQRNNVFLVHDFSWLVIPQYLIVLRVTSHSFKKCNFVRVIKHVDEVEQPFLLDLLGVPLFDVNDVADQLATFFFELNQGGDFVVDVDFVVGTDNIYFVVCLLFVVFDNLMVSFFGC